MLIELSRIAENDIQIVTVHFTTIDFEKENTKGLATVEDMDVDSIVTAHKRKYKDAK